MASGIDHRVGGEVQGLRDVPGVVGRFRPDVQDPQVRIGGPGGVVEPGRQFPGLHQEPRIGVVLGPGGACRRQDQEQAGKRAWGFIVCLSFL